MRRLAWPLFGLWVLLAVTSSALQVAAGDPTEAALVAALVVLAGVGAILCRRRPENPIGWILLFLALLITGSSVTSGVYTVSEGELDPSLPIQLLVWFDEWVIYLWFGLVGILLPLLFPDGRLPSRRWRPVLWAGVVVVVMMVLSTALGTPTFDWGEEGSIDNPLAVGGRAGQVLVTVGTASNVALVAILLASLTGVTVRLRRATGIERQQLKWFVYAVGLLLSGLTAAAISEGVGYEPLGNIGWSVFLASLVLGMPLAIAVAVLRYRLYGIDVVIKRTIVYGSLTAALVSAYLGMVLILRVALGPLTGESDLAVAASTLTVAALFRPLRARIQSLVDKRFYRQRYDATRTLEDFGLRLRTELDLNALGSDLRHVVHDTMQPAHVSLWLPKARR